MPREAQNCAEVLITAYSCVLHSQEIMQLEFMTEAVWQSLATRFKIAKGIPPAWSTAEGFLMEIESGKRTYRDNPRPH
jgi:hypothetical protein